MSTLDGGRIGIASQALGIARAASKRPSPTPRSARPSAGPSPTSRPSSSRSPTWRPSSTRRACSCMRAAFMKDQKASATRPSRPMAKLFASEMATRVTHQALQIYGGYGYSRSTTWSGTTATRASPRFTRARARSAHRDRRQRPQGVTAKSRKPMKTFVSRLALAMLIACGGAEETQEEQYTDNQTSGGDSYQEPDDGVEINGLMGTISARSAVTGARATDGTASRSASPTATTPSIWWAAASSSAFRIHDGRHGRVGLPSRLHHRRPTDRGVLVRASHRARTSNGRAAAKRSSTGPSPSTRPTTCARRFNWDAERAADLVAERGPEVIESCGARALHRHRLHTAGRRGDGGWREHRRADGGGGPRLRDERHHPVAMPDPGSYPAKITFELR